MEPTENDRRNIPQLAQKIIDLVQEYARQNDMTLQGVISAIGTSSGAILARAYRDTETANDVAVLLTCAAQALIEQMHRPRREN